MRLSKAMLAGVVLSLGAAYVARVPLLEGAGRFLIEEDAPQRADAIVVLSGSFPDRILEAVALYEDKYAPLVVLCREPENAALSRLKARGVDMRPVYERNRFVAESLGVPPDAIYVVDRSGGSTFDEAEQVLRYLRKRNVHTILLVTSKIHTRRAAAIYRHLAGSDMRILIRPARDDPFRPQTWWGSRAAMRRVVIEYEKLLVFHLLDRWLNEPIGKATDAS